MNDLPDVVRIVSEYYDFVDSLGEVIDPLQAAMFAELEFDIVIPDAEINARNLSDARSASDLVWRLLGQEAAAV